MGANYEAWKINTDDYFREMTTRGRLEFLVGFAVLAPSSHNAQPWKFKIIGNSIEILPDRSRAVPVADPKEKYLYTGLGCAVENIVIAAGYFGLKPKVEYITDESENFGARVVLLFSEANGTPVNKGGHLIYSIPSRCTNRNKYDTDRYVPAEFIEKIKLFSREGVGINISTDIKKRKKLADILVRARVEAFDNFAFRAEFSKHQRNNLTKSSIGITGNTMGFNTLKSLFASFAVKNFNVLRLIAKEELKLFSTYSPTHIIISTKKETKQSWMKAGRTYQRICLFVESKGISSAVSMLPYLASTKKIKDIFNIKYNPYIFIRLGYTEEKPPHAPRMRAKEVIN